MKKTFFILALLITGIGLSAQVWEEGDTPAEVRAGVNAFRDSALLYAPADLTGTRLIVYADSGEYVDVDSSLYYDIVNTTLGIKGNSYPGISLTRNASDYAGMYMLTNNDMSIYSVDAIQFTAERIAVGTTLPSNTYWSVGEVTPVRLYPFTVYRRGSILDANAAFRVDSAGAVYMPLLTGIGTGTSILQYNRTTGKLTYADDAGGGGDVSGVAGNALTYAGDSLGLGGPITTNTYITNATEDQAFTLRTTLTSPNQSSYLSMVNGAFEMFGYPTSDYSGTTYTLFQNNNLGSFVWGMSDAGSAKTFTVSTSAMTITDAADSKGLVYAGDYSANYTARSLVDRGYVAANYLNVANLSPAASDLWFTSDTIVLGSFSKDTTRTTDFYGSFYNDGSDTLVVTSMTAVLQGSSPSVAVDVQWHATFNSGSATHLVTTPPTVTSTTVGDETTVFNNAQIPPGVWVWMETPTVTTPATYISVSLSGYRLNRAY